MVEILVWPHDLLIPKVMVADVVPFTRSGGRTLGGLKPAYATDLGFWRVDYSGILLHRAEQKRTWDAIATYLKGSSGRIAVPVWSIDSAPYSVGLEAEDTQVLHSNGQPFSNGMGYSRSAISIISNGITGIGATVMSMRIVDGEADIAGTRFSYNHAAYKVGQILATEGDTVTVSITPSVAALIPHEADLEFTNPTCICNLLSDTGMKRGMRYDRIEEMSLSFVEDTKFWSDLAEGVIT